MSLIIWFAKIAKIDYYQKYYVIIN